MKRLVLAAAVLLTARCATMVNGTYQSVPVNSQPAGAVVAVDCADAKRDGGVTPTTIQLPRGAETCSITLSKAGYESWTVDFRRQASRATAMNRVPGVIVGTLGAVLGVAAVLDDHCCGDDLDLPAEMAQGGYKLGSAAGNSVDQRTGGAWKQVPGEVFVRLDPLPPQ